MSGIVSAGNYKKRQVVVVFGKVYIQASLRQKIYINSDTVEAYELIERGQARITVTTWSVKSKKMLVDVKFRDGKKSLIECDQKTYSAIVKACY